MATAGTALAACVPAPSAPAAPAATGEPAAVTEAPAATTGRTVRIAVGGWAEQGTRELLANTGLLTLIVSYLAAYAFARIHVPGAGAIM